VVYWGRSGCLTLLLLRRRAVAAARRLSLWLVKLDVSTFGR